jgi:hypothetical protein
MQDLIYLSITLLFFALAIWYVRSLENLRGGGSDE